MSKLLYVLKVLVLTREINALEDPRNDQNDLWNMAIPRDFFPLQSEYSHPLRLFPKKVFSCTLIHILCI